jgi:hypothetical protein
MGLDMLRSPFPLASLANRLFSFSIESQISNFESFGNEFQISVHSSKAGVRGVRVGCPWVNTRVEFPPALRELTTIWLMFDAHLGSQ